MGTSSILNGASQGLQSSMVRMADSAAKVAWGSSPNDIVEPMVSMIAESSIYAANAQVIKVADEVIGTLLDEQA